MEMANWYTAEDGQQAGPFTATQVASQIQQGHLTEVGYVFQQGMDGWMPATSHPDFQSFFASPSVPPPPPTRTASTATGGFAISRTMPAATDQRIQSSPSSPKRETAETHERVPYFFRRQRRGIVRDVQIREVSTAGGGATEYLSFRLERTDDRGNVVEQIPVEMKGNIPGRVLRDGDEVIVAGRRRRHAIKPRAVYVIGTESRIRPRRNGLIVVAIVSAIVGVLLLAADNAAGGVLLVAAVLLAVIWLWRKR